MFVGWRVDKLVKRWLRWLAIRRELRERRALQAAELELARRHYGDDTLTMDDVKRREFDELLAGVYAPRAEPPLPPPS